MHRFAVGDWEGERGTNSLEASVSPLVSGDAKMTPPTHAAALLLISHRISLAILERERNAIA